MGRHERKERSDGTAIVRAAQIASRATAASSRAVAWRIAFLTSFTIKNRLHDCRRFGRGDAIIPKG